MPFCVAELIQIHKQSAYLVGRDRIVGYSRLAESRSFWLTLCAGIGHTHSTPLSIETARRDTISADHGEE